MPLHTERRPSKKILLKFVNRFAVLALVVGVSSFEERRNPYEFRTVVIDSGHGGKDAGCIGPGGTREKNVALRIALELGQRIKEAYPDVKVVYTRKTDVFIELHERSAIANRNRADLFISIHCNSVAGRKTGPYGTETFVMGLHKSEGNLEVAKRENAVILQEENYKKTYKGFDPNSPLAHIMLTNYQSAYLASSVEFASKVESQFKQTSRHSRGVKQAGLLVLWETAMPAVLIEAGFLSNPAEEKFMKSEAGQQKLAGAIFRAFEQYKEDREAQ
jgi:N-acetylmuramoyl-L-alanine amidase